MVENIVQNYILELQTQQSLAKPDEYESCVRSNISILMDFVDDLKYIYLNSSLKESSYVLPDAYQ